MKLIVVYKESWKGKDRLFPRDIRNYIASITKDDSDVHQEIMKHDRKQPTFIFSIPNRKSFAIYCFKNDRKSKSMMETIKKRIKENPKIDIGGVSVEAGKVYIAKFDFTRFERVFYIRRLRTPLVIASCDYEYAICRKLSVDGKVDMQKLKKYTVDKIKETIGVMVRDWFGEEERERVEEILSDATIMLNNLEYTPIKYKKNQYYPAIRGEIVSDVNLPLFIGYKCGLGYGELSTPKEMQRREK